MTPVEFDFFVYTYRQNKQGELHNYEYLVRLVNTFIFNSHPNLKNSHRIKDPKKLYKISAELEHLEQAKKETTYRDLPPEQVASIAQFLQNLN